MIRDFLAEKGIACQYFQGIVGLQGGVGEIPIFVADEDAAPELPREIEAFLRMDHADETAGIPELAPAESDPVSVSAQGAPGVWGPFQAFALYLFVAFPGGFAVLSLMLGVKLAGDLTLWNLFALMILIVFILKKRQTLRGYLNLGQFRERDAIWAVGAYFGFYVAESMLFREMKIPVTPGFWRALQAAPVPTAIGAILIEPVVDEAIFRGFLFKSFESSRPWLGVVLTAAVGSAFLLQLNSFEIAAGFLAGLLLGYSRMRSGSLVPAILAHIGVNFIAVVSYYLR